MALGWRRGPHLQPTPPSVSSVLLAPSLPSSLFKPPPLCDLYDPDALLGDQDLPCSRTLPCLSVTCCCSLGASSAFQPDGDIPRHFRPLPVLLRGFLLDVPPPSTPSLLPWLNCPYLWFGSNAVSPRNPSQLSSGGLCWVCSCKGDALLSPCPHEVFPCFIASYHVCTTFLACIPGPRFVGKSGVCRILYHHFPT